MYVHQNINFKSDLGYQTVTPLHQEYIAGLLCNNNLTHANALPSSSDIIEITKLIDHISYSWTINNYSRKLSFAKNPEELAIKNFEAYMSSNYGLVRGYSWFSTISLNQHKELFTLIDSDLKTILGFTIQDIILFLNKWHKLIEYRMNEQYKKFLLKLILKNEKLDAITKDPSSLMNDYLNDANIRFKDILLFDLKDLLVDFSDNEKAEYTTRFNTILDFFTSKKSNDDYKYFSQNSVYQLKPILMFENKYLIQNLQHFEMNIKEAITDEIKSKQKIWKKYLDKRGEFLEQKTKNIFNNVFKDNIYYSSLYYDFDGEHCELDGLIEFGDTLLLIEAKSGQYHSSAKSGGLLRLKDNISDSIEFATKQAIRSKEYILSAEKVTFTNKKGNPILNIQHKNFQNVYVINVTLEYFAELAVDLHRLTNLKLFNFEYFPWSICLNDLEVISEFLQDPYEFLHYIHFRTSFTNYLTNSELVSYELDLLAYYCHDYTFMPEMLTSSPDLGEIISSNPPPSILDNPKNFNVSIYQQVADASPYFNYYFNNKAVGTTVDVVKRTYTKRIQEIINKLKSYKKRYNVSFLLYFLELSEANQLNFENQLDNLIQLYENDHKDHNVSITNFFTEIHSIRTCGCTIFVASETDRIIVKRNASLWCAKKKDDTNSTDWIGIIYYLDEDLNYINDFILTGDSYYGIDNIEKVSLAKDVGRNDPCPCGSSKKYKKCHGKN